MRIAILSDIHGNLEALSALPAGYDELWVLGDLVNYGPNPAEVVEFVRANATLVVQGNHDYSAGTGDDPRCSARFRQMAQETGRFTASVLTEGQKAYLRNLPTSVERAVGVFRFYLCHATPSDPLFAYRGPDAPEWLVETERVETDVLLVGHTHLPFVRAIGQCRVVNPGSLGQPKSGSPQARYAMWEDGSVEIRGLDYPLELTVRKLRSMPVSITVQDDLAAVLRTGSTPG